jgi:glyoxylase-like metal-dependent hydrolase (beta-lactamase superfamily II)
MHRVSLTSLVVLVSLSSVTHAQAGDARQVLRESAEAIGGLDRLRALRSVRVEETGGEYLVSTVTRADAPPKLIVQTMTTLRSARDTAMRRTMTQIIPMRAGRITGTTVANRGVVASFRGPSLVPGGTFDAMVATEELRLSPESALLTALDAADVRLTRDTVFGEVRHRVVAFTLEGAPVRLFIDAASHVPTRVELTRAYPTNVFWAMWGDLRFLTTWSGWALEPSGLWYPRQRTVTLNGAPFREYVVASLELDAAESADSISIPDSVRAAFTTRVAAERVIAPLPKLTPVEIADGVVLYQGGYQAAAVRQGDGIVIIEGPESNAKSRAVLADVASRWPTERVKGVISTSPMWMHIGGLREYAARGIPIYALDVNVSIVRALVASPHTQSPDSLARARRAPIVRGISTLTTIGAGANRLELRPARGQHSSSMVLVWFPASRLLYASDVMIPDAFEPVFARGYAEELQRVVRREGLDVGRVFAEHLPVAPWGGVVR